jgi:hypothetical protein
MRANRITQPTHKSMTKDAPRIRLKSVALPVEHGAWGFLFEPILLGLLAGPSPTGLWLALSAIGVFLLHHPLNLALKDRLRGKRYPRTILAERFTVAYAVIALIGFVSALVTTNNQFWLLILLGIPFAVIRGFYALGNRGREVVPELCGAIALGAVAPAIALSAGFAVGPALALWAIPVARAAASILYVRARLRLDRGEQASRATAIAAHVVGLVVISGFVIAGLLPWLSIVALVVLLVRAVVGLSTQRRIVAARTVGFQEVGYGLLTAVLVALGYWL